VTYREQEQDIFNETTLEVCDVKSSNL
jgi:hypothetical protein